MQVGPNLKEELLLEYIPSAKNIYVKSLQQHYMKGFSLSQDRKQVSAVSETQLLSAMIVIQEKQKIEVPDLP